MILVCQSTFVHSPPDHFYRFRRAIPYSSIYVYTTLSIYSSIICQSLALYPQFYLQYLPIHQSTYLPAYRSNNDRNPGLLPTTTRPPVPIYLGSAPGTALGYMYVCIFIAPDPTQAALTIQFLAIIYTLAMKPPIMELNRMRALAAAWVEPYETC